jgi:hypothetical protein
MIAMTGGVVHTSAAPTSAAPVPDSIPIGMVLVDASNSGGANSSPLIGGQPYLFTVTGRYTPGANTVADAECSATAADPHMVHDRYLATAGADMFGLQVDRQDVSWSATTPDPAPGDAACSSANNRYTLAYTPPTTKTVNFRVPSP